MYGTSEDFHAAHGESASASHNLTASSVDGSLSRETTDREQDALGELLHKAWTILKSKS